MRLLRRNCIITGASRGLGRRMAHAFWRQGASVLLAARDATSLEGVVESLEQARVDAAQTARFVSCDLADESAVETIVGAADAAFESLSVLVNNAATLGPVGPLDDNDRRQWERSFQVNLFSPAALCAALLPRLRSEPHGKIINLSGGGATGPRPGFSAYAAAKTALVRLAEVLAHENRAYALDVNCIAPGVMNTRMMEEILAAGETKAGAREIEQARAQARESGAALERAAELAVFLASAASNGVTGRLISAVWDPWETLDERVAELSSGDEYTLRRIVHDRIGAGCLGSESGGSEASAACRT